MPYQRYRNMSDEDLASVVVHLRSLPAVHNRFPATEVSGESRMGCLDKLNAVAPRITGIETTHTHQISVIDHFVTPFK